MCSVSASQEVRNTFKIAARRSICKHLCMRCDAMQCNIWKEWYCMDKLSIKSKCFVNISLFPCSSTISLLTKCINHKALLASSVFKIFRYNIFAGIKVMPDICTLRRIWSKWTDALRLLDSFNSSCYSYTKLHLIFLINMLHNCNWKHSKIEYNCIAFQFERSNYLQTSPKKKDWSACFILALFEKYDKSRLTSSIQILA